MTSTCVNGVMNIFSLFVGGTHRRCMMWRMFCMGIFFFQAEDGIRDLVRSRGLGDVYKRQENIGRVCSSTPTRPLSSSRSASSRRSTSPTGSSRCLLYTSDAADERSSVDLGGRRIIKKKTQICKAAYAYTYEN